MALAGLRTIRGQLIASLVLFECLALTVFSAVLLHELNNEAHQRMTRRLEYQASELEVVTTLALRNHNTEMLHTVVTSMLQFPTISGVKVTDMGGTVLAASGPSLNDQAGLTPWERDKVPEIHSLQLFERPGGRYEAAMPVKLEGQRAALIWIYPNDRSAHTDLRELARVSAWGVIAVLAACTLLATLIARSLSRPLVRLLAATQVIISNPADTSSFPLQVTSRNEVADLTIAFNLMVASIEEQRTGLSDTLSLLDSMLANAPIGIAFFDRTCRFVRVNQYLAEGNSRSLTYYLGRRLDEIFAPSTAAALTGAVKQVFEHGTLVEGLEVSGVHDAADTWMVNAYPVRTGGHVTRWAGVVLINITERLRAEQALRETEKLAVTGRLSASIAHEINNPLEAVTNLLYLLRHHGSLAPEATVWADAAQHEVARVSEIAQQTLRFYRQSSRRELTSLVELLNAVLTLHQGRVATLQVVLDRRYRDVGELVCFAGELRQLFANLIGNALDAMQPDGGRLTVAVRASRLWSGDNPSEAQHGVRVTIADTGCGMSAQVRQRIFEPFYTTKEATGTGLGLWVSSEIMVKHAVVLRIRSREAAGEAGDGKSDGNGASSSDQYRSGGTVFMLFFPHFSAAQHEVVASIEAQAALNL